MSVYADDSKLFGEVTSMTVCQLVEEGLASEPASTFQQHKKRTPFGYSTLSQFLPRVADFTPLQMFELSDPCTYIPSQKPK